MSMVHVVAVITTKSGERAAVLKTFNENVPNVLAEDGCIEYGAAIDCEGVGAFQTPCGEDTFMVIEKWQSLAHLMAHAATPHMATYAKSVKDKLADRKIHVLSGV